MTTTSKTPKAASQIGKTILEQMGGRRLGMMLGVKRFLLLPKGLAFQWPNRERSKGNYVEITLTPNDTYDMEFFNLSTRAKKPVKKYRDVYVEDLIPVFERQTGWLARMASKTAAVTPQDMNSFFDLLREAQKKSARWDLDSESHKIFVEGLSRYLKIAERQAPAAMASSTEPFEGVRKGDIMFGDEGATMSLPVFYEVQKDTPIGKMVTLRRLKSHTKTSDGFIGHRTPMLGQYDGPPVRAKLGHGYDRKPVVNLKRVYLKPWDGKPKYYNSLD